MASPQKENGYTAIANELLEAMAKAPLNGTQFRVLTIIIRQTYGYKRKEHSISESFLAKATGIHDKQISREIKKLIELNVLTVIQKATYTAPRILALNKNWEEWILPTKTIPPNESAPSHPANPLPLVPTNPLGKERKYKENTKEIYEHFEKLWQLYPKKKGKGSISDSKKKELFNIPFDEMERAVDRYKAEIKRNKTDEKYIKHGSTFFNSGYVDYLDVNFDCQEEDEPVKTTSIPRGWKLI